MSTVDVRTRLQYVMLALIQALDEGTGHLWGDGVAPGPVNATPTYPYGIVYAIPGGTVEGGAGRPAGRAVEMIQLTSVGRTRLEAQNLAGLAFDVMVGRTGSGWSHEIDDYSFRNAATKTTVARSLAANDHVSVWHRSFDSSGGHQQEGPVHNWADRYVVKVQPTG